MTKDQFDYEVMRELHEIEDEYEGWPEHKRPGYAERIAEQVEYLRKREREEKLIRSEK